MRLSTLARVKRRLPLATTTHDALLTALLTGVSGEVERYLGRHAQRTARTEQYDVDDEQTRWWFRGYPVDAAPAPTIKLSVDRDFTNVVAEPGTDYYLRAEDGRLELLFTYNRAGYRFPGALQVVYTGGMAPTVDRLSAALSAAVGSFTGTETITGGTSGATATHVSSAATTITMIVTNGEFEVGEMLTGGTSLATATLGALTATPLCQGFPEVVSAVDEQVAFLFQRREQLGLSSFSSEGGSLSFSETGQGLLKHAQAMLDLHRARGVTR